MYLNQKITVKYVMCICLGANNYIVKEYVSTNYIGI